MSTPIRMCIACRTRRAKKELFRITRTPAGIVEFDPLQRKQGRGVYLCRDISCIKKAKAKGLLGRSLKTKVPISIYTELIDYLENKSEIRIS